MLTTPASGHANAEPLAIPPVYAPNVPLMAGLWPLAGSIREGTSDTEAGGGSCPKLGGAPPRKLSAVMVALNGWPAAVKTVPAAVLAAGLATFAAFLMAESCSV